MKILVWAVRSRLLVPSLASRKIKNIRRGRVRIPAGVFTKYPGPCSKLIDLRVVGERGRGKSPKLCMVKASTLQYPYRWFDSNHLRSRFRLQSVHGRTRHCHCRRRGSLPLEAATYQPALVRVFLIMDYDLDELLLSLLGSKELVDKWWNSPNRMFGYDTPQQAFRDRPDNVVWYISRMAYA